MQLLISWSGDKSRNIAHALRDWLPLLFQSIRPWLSDKDMQAGSRWPQELASALDETNIGVICLTRENLTAPWILFEAGALAKSVAQSRIIPFLVDLEPSTMSSPLSLFQAVSSDKEGVRRLVRIIAESQTGSTPTSGNLDRLFEALWPQLEEKLQQARLDADRPRIALLGATTHEIEDDPIQREAITSFYRSFFAGIERTPYGINCCGAEPVRRAFFQAYCDKLYCRSMQAMQEVRRRVRWYWFPGDDLGFNYPPPYYDNVKTKDAIDRTLKEVFDANVIVAIAGRTGTREQVERLLRYHTINQHGINLAEKRMYLLGWFGGAVKELIDERHSSIEWMLEKYCDLEPADFVEGWYQGGVVEGLAHRLVLHLERHLAGEDQV